MDSALPTRRSNPNKVNVPTFSHAVQTSSKNKAPPFFRSTPLLKFSIKKKTSNLPAFLFRLSQ